MASGFWATYIEKRELPDAETSVDIFMDMAGMDPLQWGFTLNFLMIFFLGAFQVGGWCMRVCCVPFCPPLPPPAPLRPPRPCCRSAPSWAA